MADNQEFTYDINAELEELLDPNEQQKPQPVKERHQITEQLVIMPKTPPQDESGFKAPQA